MRENNDEWESEEKEDGGSRSKKKNSFFSLPPSLPLSFLSSINHFLTFLFLSSLLSRPLCVTARLLLSPGAPRVEREMAGFGFVPLEGDRTADQSAVAASAAAGAAPAATPTTTATTTASAGGAFDVVPSLQLPRAAPSAGTVSEITMKGC